jgi:hypothetical protein
MYRLVLLLITCTHIPSYICSHSEIDLNIYSARAQDGAELVEDAVSRQSGNEIPGDWKLLGLDGWLSV